MCSMAPLPSHGLVAYDPQIFWWLRSPVGVSQLEELVGDLVCFFLNRKTF